MPEPIPPLWYSLIGNTLLLRDETIPLNFVTSLDFYGDHVYASVVEGSKGVVVVKNENPIGSDADTPAYFSSHGSFTTPLNDNTTQFLVHEIDESHNFTLVSGTMVVPAVSGLYATTLIVWGQTTSDICTDGDPVEERNFENKVFSYSTSPARYQGSTLQQSFRPNIINSANCYLDTKMVTDGAGLFFLTAGTHRVMVLVGVIPVVSIFPGPNPLPSSSGEFLFTIQRVSLGS